MKFKVVKETKKIETTSNDSENETFRYRLLEMETKGEDFNKSEMTIKTDNEVLKVGDEYELKTILKQETL